ncbi:YndJ family protein [Bacillus niameyensis]|uniref:YndJ family protein n=1 Tax=Bacillus niameyensis TaxID=1522308 RepID=UPI000783EF55|nr:YndJ family protein [Bacillus niameyensis]
MTLRTFSWIHSLLFLVIAYFSVQPWPSLMLTLAQIVFIPIVLQLVQNKGDWFYKNYFLFAIPAYIAVAILQWTDRTAFDGGLAAIYLLFTLVVSLYGVARFLRRGFRALEEFTIDLGLIYLAIGGMWFFASEANIDTGFSALITWLTAIHFHYSAFLLPIFVGFLGRLRKPRLFRLVCFLILISPLVVAIGITFSRWIELFSVIFYIIGIIGLLVITLQARFKTAWQKSIVLISFAALPVTIGFSLLYALGNLGSSFYVTIDFMLRFHGVMNCLIFGLLGVIGWSLCVPISKVRALNFPVSRMRGKIVVGERLLKKKIDNRKKYRGLVDNMEIYESVSPSPSVRDFYENTLDYRLFAIVKWKGWFKPLAYVYRFASRHVKQLNLPFSNKEVEMIGGIYPIHDDADGRKAPRAWVRKVRDEVVFVAIYSEHQTETKTYMNIALPLPWSSMIGILELKQMGEGLQLSSKGCHESDAGIYLAWKQFLFKLPLSEVFHVDEVASGELKAHHKMRILGVPFLTIDYRIVKKDG